MISEKEYFSHLYEVASSLNKEFTLHAALKKALEKTVQLLELETGWIWLIQEKKEVYLAATYNLPPALKDHPERLSGRCYCIEKYLSNGINKPLNISEIACTRLQDLKSGTFELKFHASVPIMIGNQKVGLINLLSKESQQLNQKQLCILRTVSELVAMAIQRTQYQELMDSAKEKKLKEVLNRVIQPKLKSIVSELEDVKDTFGKVKGSRVQESLEFTALQAAELLAQLSQIQEETDGQVSQNNASKGLQLPATPLTDREFELLPLIKKGYTNKQIAEALFISERTVKFHISSILSKLTARTRTEAIDIALKRGLVSL